MSEFFEAGNSVDVMLLDIRMPVKSGLEAVRDAAGLPPYPIIAMTGHVDTEAQNDFKAAGFRGCLGKPFTSAALKQALLIRNTPEWFAIIQ